MKHSDSNSMSLNRTTIRALQPVEPDRSGSWQPTEAPLEAFRLKMNLPYIRSTGFTKPDDIPEATIRSLGYSGAIRLKGEAVTYLYR